jgi:tRNA(Ile)-lysidine synthase
MAAAGAFIRTHNDKIMIAMKTGKPQQSSKAALGDRVREALKKYSMLGGGERVLVGLSGGPDSVCLLHLLGNLREEYGLTLHAVYVNHNLRPRENAAEITFCRELCRSLGVDFIARSAEVSSYADAKGMNTQEAARELRYKVFEETAKEHNAGKIALGHNADDQAETFFMRVLRGAGPMGLSGIPPVRGSFIRPLIEIERDAIESFLEEKKIPFVVDSSNLKTDYARNRLRHGVMPLLKQFNPNLTSSLGNTMSVLREEERYFTILVTKTMMKLISRKTAGRIELFLSPLESLEKVILRRVLRRAIEETEGLRGIGFVHIENIIALIKEGRSGDRLSLPKGIRVIRDYSLLVMTSEPPVRISTYDLQPPAECVLRGAGLVIKAFPEERPEGPEDGRSSVVLDAGLMQFPLKVRSRQDGDFFYPLGFGKRKKLQDFFVDEKIARDERDAVPVVVSGSDIIWIAGHRADERFRVTGNTVKFLRLVLLKGNF